MLTSSHLRISRHRWTGVFNLEAIQTVRSQVHTLPPVPSPFAAQRISITPAFATVPTEVPALNPVMLSMR
jgi:hypothetical protein